MEHQKWQGRVRAIHEGGMPFGERTAVFHASHTDFDAEEDVPVLPHPLEGQYESKSWEVEDQGRKLYVAYGELWKNEWVEPGVGSPRLRGDPQPSSASFIVDGSGTRRPGSELTDEGRWLWFRPEVIPAIAHRRGAVLSWYTRDTGGVKCVPGGRVHFGVNKDGLVTVYAKDIGILPEWQQRIWAAHNVAPQGGVAEELQAAQVRGWPADTLAPEEYLIRALACVGAESKRVYGVSFVRVHEELDEILERTHRFRAVDRPGLFALAKDLARVTADLLDVTAIKSALPPERREKLGSLKAMERVLASRIGDAEARRLMGPLFGIYDLRLGDAHLPGADLREAFRLAGLDESCPLVHQGRQLIHACVSTLYSICEILRKADATDDSG